MSAYGYRRDELIGLHVRDLRPPGATASFEQQWQAAGAETGSLFETVHQRKDGTTFPVEISAAPVEIDGRNYRQCFNRDISHKKSLERDVAHLSRIKRASFAVSDVILHAASESSLFADACKAIAEFTGYRLVVIHQALDDAEKSVRVAAAAGESSAYASEARIVWADSERGRGPVGTALRTGEIQVNQSFAADGNMAPWHLLAEKHGLKANVDRKSVV